MIFDMRPELIGQMLHLRPLNGADRSAMFAAASDPLIWELHLAKRFMRLNPAISSKLRQARVNPVHQYHPKAVNTASPICDVVNSPPKSGERAPLASALATAASIRSAASASPNE